MEAYAVIETGGKQYRVVNGATLNVELLDSEAGETISLGRVLALSDGTNLTIGTPVVEGATVTAEVLEHIRGKKVVSFKKKRRKGYKKKIGHRQELTVVRITALGETDQPKKVKEAAQKETVETAEVSDGV